MPPSAERAALSYCNETSTPMPNIPNTDATGTSGAPNETNIEKIKRGAIDVGAQLGVDPKDILTAVSYETGGTFDPWKAGPVTQYGQHRGLIQWGEDQRHQYGVDASTDPYDQMLAVGRYLKDRGVESGMGLLDIYSAINAGRVGLYNASDEANGGAPGTVRDKVENQMASHAAKAAEVLGGDYAPAAYVADSRSQGPDDRPPSAPSWLESVAPNPWFAPPVDNTPAPTWADVGWSVLRSPFTSKASQFLGNISAVPDLDWLSNHDTAKFGPVLDGLNDDERSWLISNAMSAAHAEKLSEQLRGRARDAYTRDHSSVAYWGSFAADLLDPVTLLAGGAAGKGAVMGMSALRASTATSVLSRLVEGGAVAAGATIAGAGIESQINPNYSRQDFLTQLGTGLVLGGAIGAKFGPKNLADDALASVAAQGGARVRSYIADIAEQRGIKLTDAQNAYLRRPATGLGADAVEGIPPSGRGLVERGIDRFTSIFSPEDLLKNRAGDRVASIFARLMPDLSGTGGRVMATADDAWSYLNRKLPAVTGTTMAVHDAAFADFLKETGADGWANVVVRGDMRTQFNRLVSTAITQPDTASPAVAKAADAWRGAFRTVLVDAKQSGAKWAQDVPEDDFYLPFMVDEGRYNAVVAKVGRDGLVSVIAQSMAEQIKPDFVSKLVSKYANRKARSAGEAATTRTKNPTTPEQAATAEAIDGIREQARADKVMGVQAARKEAGDQIETARSNAASQATEVRETTASVLNGGDVSALRSRAATLREEVRQDRQLATDLARTIVEGAQRDAEIMAASARTLAAEARELEAQGKAAGRIAAASARMESRAESIRLEAEAADLLEQADLLENYQLGLRGGKTDTPAALRAQAADLIEQSYATRLADLLPDHELTQRELGERIANRRSIGDRLLEVAAEKRKDTGRKAYDVAAADTLELARSGKLEAKELWATIRKRLDEAKREADELRTASRGSGSMAKLAEAAEASSLASDLAASTRRAATEALRKIAQAKDEELSAIRATREKAVADVIADANERKAEAFRQLYEEAFQTEFEKASKDYADRLIARYAQQYLKVLEDSNIFRSGGQRSAAISGTGEEAIRGALSAAGVDDASIDILLDTLGSARKSGPGSFRRRAPLNREKSYIPEAFQSLPNATDYAVSLRDISHSDIERIFERYARDTYGHAALASQGWTSEAAARAEIDSAVRFQENVMRLPEGGQSVTKSQLTAAQRELHFYVDKILGKSTSDLSEKARLGLSIMKNLSFVRFMQQSGIAQFGDAPKVILNYGIRAAWQQFRLRDFADVWRVGETVEGNALLREVQMATGLGVKTITGKLSPIYEDLTEDIFSETASTTFLRKMAAASGKLANLTSNVALINPITDALQLWAARSAAQRILDYALGRHLLPENVLREMGVDAVLVRDLKGVAKRMDIDKESGLIRRFNHDAQRAASRENADAYDRFMSIVAKEARRVILEPAPSGMWSAAQRPGVSLLFQFKTYMLNSLLSNTARNIKMGGGQAALSLMVTSAWAGLVYAAQQYVQSLGRADGQRYRDERLSLKSILSAGFQRSPDSSVLPMLIDTAINVADKTMTGEDHMLFSNTRNSGLGSNLTDSIPALRVAEELGSLGTALLASPLRGDQTFDQKDAQLLRDFVPFARSIGLLNATNAFITASFPEKDDEPLVRKAR